MASGCVEQIQATGEPGRAPTLVAPASLDGLTFRREPDAEADFDEVGPNSLLTDVQLYTVQQGDDVQGYLQLGVFKPGLDASNREVRGGVLDTLGGGNFEPTRIGRDLVFVRRSTEQRFYLWFPPSGGYFQLLVAGQRLKDPTQVVQALLAFQRGDDPGTVNQVDVLNPQRGAEI